MKNGQSVADKLGGKGQGLPWITILDANGEELVNSTGPDGNIGCPVKEQERAYFIEMIEKTKQHAGDEQIKQLAADLGEYAASL